MSIFLVRAQPSIRCFTVSRLTCYARGLLIATGLGGVLLAEALAPSAQAADVQLAPGFKIEVVATSIPRPAQLALTTAGRLVVLSQGWRGDSAAEIFWLDPRGAVPIDVSRAPRVVIPFAEGPRKTAPGSLAVDPRSDDVILGEENGNRIYRLTTDKRLVPVAVGLNHLLGGSSLALDPSGKLVVLDYASFQAQLRSEAPLPPSLAALAAEDYQGPLVFRIDLDEDVPLPRRLEIVAPIFPKRSARRNFGEPALHKFVAVVPIGKDELALLSVVGEVFVLSPEGDLRRLTRLPPGHFQRTSMAVAPDRSVFVSAGFHIRELYRVSPAGDVTSLAHDLADPQGVVVDRAGVLYVAETALHRIIRIVPVAR